MAHSASAACGERRLLAGCAAQRKAGWCLWRIVSPACTAGGNLTGERNLGYSAMRRRRNVIYWGEICPRRGATEEISPSISISAAACRLPIHNIIPASSN